MKSLRSLLLRLRDLFRREKLEREIRDELSSHLAMNIEDNVRAGMSPEEARREALLKLGGVEQTKEIYLERSGLPVLEFLLQDLHLGLRMLQKNPGFTAVAVLTLALGIGASTTIFSVMNAVLLRPLALEEPPRVVYVQEQWRDLFPGLSVAPSCRIRPPIRVVGVVGPVFQFPNPTDLWIPIALSREDFVPDSGARLLVGGGMQQSHENDSSLRQFVLQGYVSASEVTSGKLRLFDKKHLIFIPAGDFHAVATAQQRSIQSRHDYLRRRKSSCAANSELKKEFVGGQG